MERDDNTLTKRQRLMAGAAVCVAALAALATACHQQPSYHIRSLHDGSVDRGAERYCIHVFDGSIDYEEASSSVRMILWNNQSDKAWDTAEKIFFIPEGDCANLSSEDEATIDIFYFVAEDIVGEDRCAEAPPGYEMLGCTAYPVLTMNGNHSDTAFAVVWLRDDSAGTYHVVNHEGGHVFGLAHPTPSFDTGSDKCGIILGGVVYWVKSVMHGHAYCDGWTSAPVADLNWPSDGDHFTVDVISDLQ